MHAKDRQPPADGATDSPGADDQGATLAELPDGRILRAEPQLVPIPSVVVPDRDVEGTKQVDDTAEHVLRDSVPRHTGGVGQLHVAVPHGREQQARNACRGSVHPSQAGRRGEQRR